MPITAKLAGRTVIRRHYPHLLALEVAGHPEYVRK
jgi:hypothetical protein